MTIQRAATGLDDPAVLGASHPEAGRIPCRPVRAEAPPYSRLRAAEAFLAAGDRAAAVLLLRAADARARELGMAQMLAEIAALAARGTIDLAAPIAVDAPSARV